MTLEDAIKTATSAFAYYAERADKCGFIVGHLAVGIRYRTETGDWEVETKTQFQTETQP